MQFTCSLTWWSPSPASPRRPPGCSAPLSPPNSNRRPVYRWGNQNLQIFCQSLPPWCSPGSRGIYFPKWKITILKILENIWDEKYEEKYKNRGKFIRGRIFTCEKCWIGRSVVDLNNFTIFKIQNLDPTPAPDPDPAWIWLNIKKCQNFFCNFYSFQSW